MAVGNKNYNKTPKISKSTYSQYFKIGEKFKMIAKWIFLVFMSGALLVGVLFITTDVFDPPIIRLSSIIRKHINLAVSMLENELQMNTFLTDDPVLKIMKTGLGPIQDRLTSLRTQTSQYEKMEKIPGGPKSFITSALAELDVHSKQLRKISIEVIEQLLLMKQKNKALTRDTLEIVEHGKSLQDDTSIKMMIINNFTLTAPTKASKELEQELNEMIKTVTLDDLVDILTHLESLYEQMEDHALSVIQLAKEMGIQDFVGLDGSELAAEEYERILTVLHELQEKTAIIEQEKLKYGKHLYLFWMLNDQKLKTLMKVFERSTHYEEEKRSAYVKLHDMIISDINKLKVRVQNLQYKYAKRTVEL